MCSLYAHTQGFYMEQNISRNIKQIYILIGIIIEPAYFYFLYQKINAQLKVQSSEPKSRKLYQRLIDDTRYKNAYCKSCTLKVKISS